MRSPACVLAIIGSAMVVASSSSSAAVPDAYMVEAPFDAPDVVISLARLDNQNLPSPVRRPRTTWRMFSATQPANTRERTHEHRHDSNVPCPACDAFEITRRQMMARAFDDLIAQLEDDEGFGEEGLGEERESDEEDSDREDSDADGLSDLDDELKGPVAKNKSLWDAPAITIQSLSSVGIGTRPEMSKSKQLPPNLASRRYAEYASATNFGGGEAKPWSEKVYRWHAPSFYHRPLYFEQVNLERYGHYNQNWKLESVLSAAHFFGRAITLPLHMGYRPPCERVYTLGRYRPGNCNPNHRYMVPITWDGILKQGLSEAALLWAVL